MRNGRLRNTGINKKLITVSTISAYGFHYGIEK